MALTNSVVFCLSVPVIVVHFAVTGNVLVGGAVGANDVASVEGTDVDIVGMIVLEVLAKSLCFD